MSPNNCDRCGHDRNMCECPKGSKQVGGDHYKVRYQHWDWVIDVRLGYLEACASKYVTRWKDKGKPLEDLQKARSYICKVQESYQQKGYRNNTWLVVGNNSMQDRSHKAWVKFSNENGLLEKESNICYDLMMWTMPIHLSGTLAVIDDLIMEAKADLAEPMVAGQGNGPQTQSNDVPEASCGGAGGSKGQQPTRSTSVEHPFGYDESRDM